MNKLGVLFLLIVLLQVGLGQLSGKGKCPTPATVTPFDVKSYLGVWYEIARINPGNFPEGDDVCVVATYTLKSNGHFQVKNTGNQGTPSGKFVEVFGDGYQPDPQQPAKLSVGFPESSPVYGPYWILDLGQNYSTSFVYSCFDILGQYHLIDVDILSRTPEISDATLKGIVQRAEALGVDLSKLKKTQQQGCKYPSKPE